MNTLLTLDSTDWKALASRLGALQDGAPGSALLSLSLDLGNNDTDWLDLQPQTPEFCYWARPEQGLYRLGLGRAVVCTSAGPARLTALQAAHTGMLQHWRHDDGGCGNVPIACLGFAFDDDGSDPLPNAQLGVPSILLSRQEGRNRVTFSTTAREAKDALNRWRTLLAGDNGTDTALPVAGGDRTLARRAWSARVAAAIASIASGELDKVVLSRTQHLTLERPITPGALLRRLIERQPAATVFAIGNRHAIFLGASPEQLVGLDGREVRADALAGTGWAAHPLHADKNRREQALVVDAVREALVPLCATLEVPQMPQVMVLQGLRHLLTPITGTLLPEKTLFDLIAALHPTPAVGGWPTAAAAEWLRQHHEKRRGWYGGGIGWIDGTGNGEIAVGLRCALIEGMRVELAAGAGIVAGSDADQEFDETEAKFATMLDALHLRETAPCRTGTR